MSEVCVSSSSSSSRGGHWDEAEVTQGINSVIYRAPRQNEKIFKDECMYCFKTPLHAGGLFVCMERFAGFCDHHVVGYCRRTAPKGFLWCKQTKKLLTEAEEPQDKVTKLAIGVEGGFSSGPKFDIVSEYAFVLHPHFDRKIPFERLTPELRDVCQQIIEREGAQRQEMLEAGVNVWEEARLDTRHLNLEQVNNGKRIPPYGWKCEEEGCDLKENLWMNLSDGAIMCGRSQYIQEGVMSKGRNHSRLHFDLTGYPLVVKLGTITKDDADVFSYDEDDSVRDPNLKQHLLHFGIDMDNVEKTEKSTLEMELDLNRKWEWSMCQEDGANLELAYGPGLTGIINIGSSCYISATLQMLLQIPDFVQAYGKECEKHFLNVAILDSHDDFNCQTAKVFSCLLNGEFSKSDSELNGIKPTQFRKIVARGNAEFSSTRQQDADEYIRLFFGRVDEFLKKPKPVDAVRFKWEQRLLDRSTNRVRYSYTEEVVLSLVIPEEKAPKPVQIMEADVPPIRATVSFADCLVATFGEQVIEDFRSPITEEVKGAVEQYRIATFPDYLIIQLKKFTLAEDCTVKKLDVNVEMPDEIDLEAYRAHGKQPEEMLLPHANSKSELSLGRPSPGIDPESYRKASDIDGLAIEQLTHLGFSIYQARYALQRVKTGINAAADWLFTNVDSIPPEEKSQEIKDVPTECRDGKEHYRMIGFISHMGNSPLSGHYVAHMLKDSKWYLFNDEKVAVSQNPPKQLGYIYLYERIGSKAKESQPLSTAEELQSSSVPEEFQSTSVAEEFPSTSAAEDLPSTSAAGRSQPTVFAGKPN